MKRLISKLPTIFFILFCAVVLSLALRGLPGNPTADELNTDHWRDNGPLELSPERGRYSLIYSMVEENSFQFSDEIGEFSKPDVGFLNGRYVSLFAPGPSFVALPGYIIGRYFGIAQVGAFAVISIFAFLNALLIRAISKKLGSSDIASTIASLVFLFGTPAFAYGVNLYQHHLSTFLILLSIYLLARFNNFFSLSAVFLLCASGIMIDNPNLFLLFPIGLVALGRIISTKLSEKKVTLSLKPLWIFAGVSVIIPLAIFGYSNYMSYGNPLQLAGTVPTPKEISNEHLLSASELKNKETLISNENKNQENPLPKDENAEKSAVTFFKTRNLLNGFYTHFLSPDRGMIYFTPVMLLSVVGIILAYQRKMAYTSLMLSISGIIILLYSMWGDPYGGWAFGSRYLIPVYALLAIFLAFALSKLGRNLIFMIPFFILSLISIGIGTLGAVTTSRNPPLVEIMELERVTGIEQKFTPERNWDFLLSDQSKSFVYQTIGNKYLSARDYYFIVTSLIGLYVSGLLIVMLVNNKKSERRIN
jgi:hypothetical protein